MTIWEKSVAELLNYKNYMMEFRGVYIELFEHCYVAWLNAKIAKEQDSLNDTALGRTVDRWKASDQLVSAVNNCVLADLEADKALWRKYSGRVDSLSEVKAEIWHKAYHDSREEMLEEHRTLMNAITPQGSERGPQ